MEDETVSICNLKEPADCQYRIDGKMSHIILCGGNQLLIR